MTKNILFILLMLLGLGLGACATTPVQSIGPQQGEVSGTDG